MPLPPVVVEISAPAATAELRGALIAACSRAVHEAECHESDGTGLTDAAGGDVAAVAIVSWQSESTVRIEVGRDPGQAWHTRILRFEPDEAPVEVFTAVGFAIGALVGRLQEGAPPLPSPGPESAEPGTAPPLERPLPPAVMPPASPPQGSPVSAPPPPPPRRTGWLGSADLLMGTGRSVTSARLGFGAAFGWGLHDGPFVALSGAVAGTPWRQGSLRERWLGLGIGPGLDVRLSQRAALSLGSEVGLEAYSARVTDARTGLTDEAQRWVGVAHARAGVIVPAQHRLAAQLGVALTLPFGTTDVTVGSTREPDPAPLRLTAFIGLRQDGRALR